MTDHRSAAPNYWLGAAVTWWLIVVAWTIFVTVTDQATWQIVVGWCWNVPSNLSWVAWARL